MLSQSTYRNHLPFQYDQSHGRRSGVSRAGPPNQLPPIPPTPQRAHFLPNPTSPTAPRSSRFEPDRQTSPRTPTLPGLVPFSLSRGPYPLSCIGMYRGRIGAYYRRYAYRSVSCVPGVSRAYPTCIENVSSPDTFRNMIRVRYMYDTLVIPYRYQMDDTLAIHTRYGREIRIGHDRAIHSRWR